MAVANASNVDPRVLHWLRKLARRKGWIKTQREFERGLQRHGRGIQLTGSEIRLVAREDLPPATREVIDKMHLALLEAEAYEREMENKKLEAQGARERLLASEDITDLRMEILKRAQP